MKKEIILAKSWIQTPKEGYYHIFDEFLTFFWKGVGYIILCFFGRDRILVNNLFFCLTKCSRNGSP